jgi:hypothetical protein
MTIAFMKNNNEFPEKDRKLDRRDKIKNKRNKPRYDDIDFSPKDINKQLKKQKEDFQDEEWEDWDRYYNH